MWAYDTYQQLWTFIGGNFTAEKRSGVSWIGSRLLPLVTVLAEDQISITGGHGLTYSGSYGVLNDSWIFNTSSSQWTLILGNDTTVSSDVSNKIMGPTFGGSVTR